MTGKVTRMFAGNGRRVWQPASERDTVEPQTVTLAQQLSRTPPPQPATVAAEPDATPPPTPGPPEETTVSRPEDIPRGDTAETADPGRRLRVARELLRSFNESA